MKRNLKSSLGLLFIIITGISFSACSRTQPKIEKPETSIGQTQVNTLPEETLKTEEDNKQTYSSTLKSVAINSKNDSLYRPLDLSLPGNKAWLRDATRQLWYRDISKEQFIEMGLVRFPNNFYELEYIADGFIAHQ